MWNPLSPHLNDTERGALFARLKKKKKRKKSLLESSLVAEEKEGKEESCVS